MTIDNSTFKFKANLKKRICATILDYGLYFLAFYIYIMYFGYENGEGGRTVSEFAALPIFGAWFIYFVAFEAYYGATLDTRL